MSTLFQLDISKKLSGRANWLVATTALRIPAMRNPYGRLLTSQSTAEALLCSTFAFAFSPMVFFDIRSLKAASGVIGMTVTICYNICIVSHLFIALNRLIAICLPMHYDTVFNTTNTVVIISISWIISVIPELLMYICCEFLATLIPPMQYLFFSFSDDCDIVYDESSWTFAFKQTKVSAENIV
ncbi:unnamed protein product [Heligmosomoides polygyrus]|uniref:G_PROTEIN_RECEP_F1_2 domain-containing protein n=1 Tax=Heligmosomoides polygyrus TaxID=6339 RepID=A0A183FIV3_HELPZ|nr:unnamed protein product [Heligmosomoides polygyrus]